MKESEQRTSISSGPFIRLDIMLPDRTSGRETKREKLKNDEHFDTITAH